MEFYWNGEWRSMVSRILDYHQDKDLPVFVLVSGVSGLGKITFLRQVLSQFLWDFERQDLLWIRDCSLELDKNHVLPIEMPSTQKTIALKSGEVYENRGVREITTWLQQSSFWGKKCLLIENIERMSLGAMNAFLKTCEEPLKNRFIFATVSDESALLSTIYSRAFLVRFSALSDQEMSGFLSQFSLDVWLEKGLIWLCEWRPWLAFDLIQKLEQNLELKSFISSLISSVNGDMSSYLKLEILRKAQDFWLLDQAINLMINEAFRSGNVALAQSWIEVKKMKNQNINEENLLRYWLLS